MSNVQKGPRVGQMSARARVLRMTDSERRGLAGRFFALRAYLASFERHGKHDPRTIEARAAFERARSVQPQDSANERVKNIPLEHDDRKPWDNIEEGVFPASVSVHPRGRCGCSGCFADLGKDGVR